MDIVSSRKLRIHKLLDKNDKYASISIKYRSLTSSRRPINSWEVMKNRAAAADFATTVIAVITYK